MKKPPVFKLEDEIAYAIEGFENENDRKPTVEELAILTKEVQAMVDGAQEAYDEWMASGAFECVVCGMTHFNLAPPACRQAYSSGEF